MYRGEGMNVKKFCLSAILLALAVAIYTLESFIPPIGIPGVKPGLSNIVTLISLMYLDKRYTACILFLRIAITSLISGTVVSFVFSVFGGVFSFIIMSVLIMLLQKKLIWAVSVSGAIFHNLGQLLAAGIMIENLSTLYYLPMLMLSAIVTGAFTGIAAQLLDDRLGDIIRRKF